MKSIRKHVFAAAIGAMLYGGAAQANLITNGDFEAGFLGWTTSGTVTIETTAAIQSVGGVGNFPTGDKVVDFGGGDGPADGLIAQTIIGTSAGTSYGIGFDYGTFKASGPASQSIKLTVRDVTSSAVLLMLTITDATATNNLAVIFDHYASIFTAIGSSTSISFANASVTTVSVDGLLDNVSVAAAVPVPGTLLLLGLGMAGLAFGMRKKA